MRAFVFDGSSAQLADVPDPVAGPGQVVLEVTAAGLCHSDLSVMSRPAELNRFPLPVILGHEACGTVIQVGAGVGGWEVGDEVAVHGPRGCGHCRICTAGEENYCRNARSEGVWPIGLGRDGALAQYLLIDDPGSLVPLDGLDPVLAAPLTDAGLTPYHAIRRSLDKLGDGSTVVVVGIGGLGHLGVQILRALTTSTIVAVDVDPAKLDLARALGAHHAVLGAEVDEVVRDVTAAAGADVVLDFVGAQTTIDLGLRSLAQRGDLTIVGLGGGAVPVGLGTVPLGTTVRTTFWGSRSELAAVLALARDGALDVHTTRLALSEVAAGYAALDAGTVVGRAVVVPG